MAWLDQVWKKNVWNPIKQIVNPPATILPNVPTAQGSLESNQELNNLYSLRKRALEQAYAEQPTGYSDEALSGLRSTMEADRNRRLLESRNRSQERAIDMGRGSSSTTVDELNELERLNTAEAEAKDAQLLMMQQEALKQDRSYLDQLRSATANEMIGIMGTAQQFNMPQYNRDVAQAQLDADRAGRNRKMVEDLAAAYLGSRGAGEDPFANFFGAKKKTTALSNPYSSEDLSFSTSPYLNRPSVLPRG